MKTTTKIAIVAVILVLFVVFVSFNASGFIFNNSSIELSGEDYTNCWTKAICNETHCQDYVIYCKGEEFVKQSPITGAVISIPEGWEDPRDEEMRERICEII